MVCECINNLFFLLQNSMTWNEYIELAKNSITSYAKTQMNFLANPVPQFVEALTLLEDIWVVSIWELSQITQLWTLV